MDWKSAFNERKWHYLTALGVFLISLATYLRTVAPTTSFWDCGEFIACSKILGVMHPPGAPLYLLIGKIMTLLPIAKDIALRVNLFSVAASAATVLLTYLIIVRLIERWRGTARTGEDLFIELAGGVIGALAFAFSDSFWFNAVEAEVYALSMLFTALVVWLALVWEERSQEAGSILIILFIFYLFGLAIGVHLLNILTFPFVLLIAFFYDNRNVRHLLLLVFIQAVIPIGLYVLLYQYNPEGMNYSQLVSHQAKAGQFLKWFGLVWLGVTLAYIYRKNRQVFFIWWIIPVFIAVAYSLYMIIYIRAGLAPPINENDPSTRDAMMYYLSRKQYGEEDMLLTFLYRKADFWKYQINLMYTRYFGWQFIGRGLSWDDHNRILEIISFRGLYGLPFFVGLFGAVHHFFRDWKRALAVGVLFLLTGYAIIIYLNQPNPQPRERDYSYVGSFFAFALWIGTGAAGILEMISTSLRKKTSMRKAVLGLTAAVMLVIVPVNLCAYNFDSHDRSGNFVPYDYSYNILQSCEKDAILFTNGDNDTFPLWFLQEVHGIRKDIRVVCLSLLNTQWYIKQLRDFEPRISIKMNDDAVDRLNYVIWKKKRFGISVSESGKNHAFEELRAYDPSALESVISDTVRFTLSPTYPEQNPQVLQVKDLMVLRILELAQWKRPVYFAVTVSGESKLGLESYLRMDGLVYKVVPYEVKAVDEKRLRKNLFETFMYRGLDDPDVYYDQGTMNLMINLRHAFLQLAGFYLERGQNDEALAVLNEMSMRIPEKNILFSNEQSALLIGDYYRRAGKPEEYKRLVQHVMKGKVMSRDEKFSIGAFYAQMYGEYDRAEEIFLEILNQNPDDTTVLPWLLQTYRWSKQYDKAIRFLEDLQARYPGDSSIQKELETLRGLQQAEKPQNP